MKPSATAKPKSRTPKGDTMITKRELEKAIDEIERKDSTTFQDCQKLATFYTIYNQLYGEVEPKSVPIEQEIVHAIGETDFIKSINGKQAEKMWAVMDELLTTLSVINDKLYDSVLRKVRDN